MELVLAGIGACSLLSEGLSLIGLISDWWSGAIAMRKLVSSVGNIAKRVVQRFFTVSKDDALKNAYNELGLSRGTRDRDLVVKRFRQLAQIHHPDHGGSEEKMQEIIIARDTILAHI